MIRLDNTRFGQIAVNESAEIRFPRGLIGFSSETRFILLERERGPIAYLQSLNNPGIALPVVDAAHLVPDYPAETSSELAHAAGLEPDDLLILVILAISPEDGSLRANLLAPLVIDSNARTGSQILLDPERYGASTRIGDPSARRSGIAPAHPARAQTAQSIDLANTG